MSKIVGKKILLSYSSCPKLFPISIVNLPRFALFNEQFVPVNPVGINSGSKKEIPSEKKELNRDLQACTFIVAFIGRKNAYLM